MRQEGDAGRRPRATGPPPPRHAARAADRRPLAEPRAVVWPRVAMALGVLVVLLVGWVSWLSVDALRARDELEVAASLVSDLQAQVLGGERRAAEMTLTQLQEHSAAASEAAHGPHWSLAAALPAIGPNVRAVQVVSEVVDGLAVRALPGLMDATDLVDPATLAPVDGRVALGPLLEAAPAVTAADAEVQGAVARIADIDPDALWPGVAGPLADLSSQVREVAMTTATAAKAVQLLPAMLGADGPREYLLLVQNNAEPRATGGIPGAVILLRAEGGAVQVLEQRSGGPLVDLADPVLPLTRAEQALFGDDLAADMRDVTFTPDFPRSAEIARAIWAQQVGGDVDGVMSVDPGALALVLRATGPVPLEAGPVADAVGGALTTENAAQVLLNTVYLVLSDPAQQDAFFARTAASVFTAVAGGQGDAAATVAGLAEGARQGRLMVWSAVPEEQALLAGTVLSGELRGAAGSSPVVGIFFNDANADKMGFYLRSEVTVDRTACRVDGSQDIAVTLSLTNTAPVGGASLPLYVTGPDGEIPAGDLRMNVLLYAPEGGLVDEVRASDGELGVTSQVHDDLAVVGRTVQVSPGENVVMEFDVTTGPNRTNAVIVRATPIYDQVTSVNVLNSCS